MTKLQAKLIEGGIIGLCVLAILMVFQGFSLALFSAGCVMVVVGALAFNLIPFAREGVPFRALFKVVIIVLIILLMAAALGIGTSFLYVAYLESTR
jgi:hypothetical protein